MCKYHYKTLCNPHHYNGHYEDWYSDEPEEPHDDVHTPSSILLLSPPILEELGTIEVSTERSINV